VIFCHGLKFEIKKAGDFIRRLFVCDVFPLVFMRWLFVWNFLDSANKDYVELAVVAWLTLQFDQQICSKAKSRGHSQGAQCPQFAL